ncbi:hypothetical protein F5B17DRAFT_425360 [Nemania serpens]|nr:hypothetical protein F5B17DRAFT_425360 [Nemania serpens]
MTDTTRWYAVAFGAGLAALLLRMLLLLLGSSVTPRLSAFFLKHVSYPLLVDRRYGPTTTRFQAVLILLYFSVNVAVLFLFTRSADDIQKRSAALAVINISPLPFIGQINALADWLGLSTAVHLLGHRIIGTTSIFHALVHTGIALKLQPRFSAITYSGFVASGASLCILVIAVLKLWIRVSLWIHALLGLAVLGGIVWHLLLLSPVSLDSKVAVGAALALLLLSGIIRVCRVVFFSPTARVTQVYIDDTGAARFVVSTKTSVRIRPGQHFYVFVAGPSLMSLRAYPLIPMPSGHNLQQENRDLMFCVADPPRSIRALQVTQRLRLDGPYGPDLHLETCENLVLAAQGVGILSILPIALYFAERKWQDFQIVKTAAGSEALEAELREAEAERSKKEREHRPADQIDLTNLKDKISQLTQQLQAKRSAREPCFRDLTRRITILWLLDHNSQARWVEKQIQLLQELDPENTLVVLWCIFPSPNTEEPLFRTSNYFVCLYPPAPDFRDLFRDRLEKEVQTPGELAVVSCGDRSFRKIIRSEVIQSLNARRLILLLDINQNSKQ